MHQPCNVSANVGLLIGAHDLLNELADASLPGLKTAESLLSTKYVPRYSCILVRSYFVLSL